jgi:GAF domain-containing protein
MQVRRIAWFTAVISMLLAAVDTAIVVASYPLLSTDSVGIHGWPLVNIAALGSAVLGAVILGSHPRHPIGWLLNIVGLTTSISLAVESYSVWVLEHDGPGSVREGHLAGWVAALLGGPFALGCLTFVFLLVPTGALLSPGWRWAAGTTSGGYVIFVVGLVLVGPNGIDRSGGPVEGGVLGEAMTSGGVILITLTIVASVVSLVLRLRRSSGVARQQLRVVATGAASIGLALVTLIVGQALNGGRQSWWGSVPLYTSYAFLVVCIAVAVLRYRLYDVEVIISRAVVLALATAFVAAGYVGLVVALGRTVEDRTDEGFWFSLLAIVVVALAFQPLRRRVLRVADRLAYGTRAAPYEALAEFSRRIGDRPAPGQLLPTIAAAAGVAVQASRTVVRVDGEAGAELTAVWPPGPGTVDHDVVVPIGDQFGVLGSIALSLPPGRDIRPVEHRLLTDIAEQAAVALRNRRLEIELASRVRQLDERTRQLAASRNRIIGAADTERQRLESAIARQVLPTMVELRTGVEGSATGVRAERIGDCVDRATAALERLRELTRGIYPTMLTRSGLGPALTSYASRALRPDAVVVDPGFAATRFSDRVEAAAYFCCVAALEASGSVSIGLSDGATELVLSLRDVSLDALDRMAIVDRVEACEGSLAAADTSVRIGFPVAVEVVA